MHIDQDKLQVRLAQYVDEATAGRIAADLATDQSWQYTAVLVEIEAAGQVSDLDAARLTDAIAISEGVETAELVGSGQVVSLALRHSGPASSELSKIIWRLGEHEGLSINDVRVSTA